MGSTLVSSIKRDYPLESFELALNNNLEELQNELDGLVSDELVEIRLYDKNGAVFILELEFHEDAPTLYKVVRIKHKLAQINSNNLSFELGKELLNEIKKYQKLLMQEVDVVVADDPEQYA